MIRVHLYHSISRSAVDGDLRLEYRRGECVQEEALYTFIDEGVALSAGNCLSFAVLHVGRIWLVADQRYPFMVDLYSGSCEDRSSNVLSFF